MEKAVWLCETNSKSCFKLSQEIEQSEIEYSNAQNRTQQVLDTMLSKKPAYQPDDHGSGSHIVKKVRVETVAIGVFRLGPANGVQSQSRVIISRTLNSGERSRVMLLVNQILFVKIFGNS